MTNVWEVCFNEEYNWQESRGLYVSLDVARAHFPNYPSIIDGSEEEGFMLLARKDLESAVRAAYYNEDNMHRNYGFWWYNIKGDTRYEACIGIFKREVRE